MSNVEISENNPVPVKASLKFIKFFKWFFLIGFLLVFFIWIQLPQIKINQYIQSEIKKAIAPYGIKFQAEDASLSLFFGVKYSMTNVELSFENRTQKIVLDEVMFYPSLLKSLFGYQAAKIKWIQDDEDSSVYFSVKNQSFSLELDLNNLNLRKLGVFSYLYNLQGDGSVSAEGDIYGNLTDFTQLNGDVYINLNKLSLKKQSVLGFSIPAVLVSTGRAQLVSTNGKLSVKDLGLGGEKDDLFAKVTGDLNFSKRVRSSKLNLEAKFKFSDKIKKSFVLLNSLLRNALQKDGFYAYSIKGTLGSPRPSPLKTKRK